MVYIYRRYDTDRTDRNFKYMIAGGLMTAAGLFFGMVDARLDTYHTTISLTGLSLMDIAKESSTTGGLSQAMLLLPVLACVIGVLTVAYAAFRLKGCDVQISSRTVMMMSAIAAIAPVVMFAFISLRAGSDTGLGLVRALFGTGVSIYPGAGSVMQIAGGIVSAVAARSNAESEC